MYKGKAIYNPSGKAQEYSRWACNFYVGCSNGCAYCYLKKGRGKSILGGDKPTLKKCFKNKEHAKQVFKKELLLNLDELRKHGLFFSFTTDPVLTETWELTYSAVEICQEYNVPVKILTKSDLLWDFPEIEAEKPGLIAIGFTLTGFDHLEPNATTNFRRIEQLGVIKKSGFKTFASIEPIIDFEESRKMIELSRDYVDLYKIGLESGRRDYDFNELEGFINYINGIENKIYLKNSLAKSICDIKLNDHFVGRDYNIFDTKN